MLIIKNEGVAWDGTIALGTIKESDIPPELLNNPAELTRAIKLGLFSLRQTAHNAVTNYARSYLTQILSGAICGPVIPSKMELGTGSGIPASSDTDLWTPSIGTLKGLSSIEQYLTYYAQYVCTWQSSDPIQGTWTELGLKDANGNLWAHAALNSPFTVNTGEMLFCQWQVQILGS